MNATLLEPPPLRAPASIGEALLTDVPHAEVSEEDLRPRRFTPNLNLPVPGDVDPADAPTDIGNLADRLDAVLSRWLVPGLIMPTARQDEPPGWLHCAGQAISRTAFAALFAAIGTTYGAGDGTTTFNLPNLVNRFPLGWGSARGEVGGAAAHVLSTEEMPVHAHGVFDPGHAHTIADPGHGHVVQDQIYANQGGWPVASVMGQGGWPVHMAPSGASAAVVGAGTGIGIYGGFTGLGIYHEGASWAHNNMPPYQSFIYLIKT